MLEGIVATILSRFLGDFVEGLQGDNLKLSLTSGEVTLSNLALKKEALSNLQLPIVVKEGFLGKLELSIPWKNLGSQPAVIKLDRIYLVAGPAKIGDDDPDVLEEKLQNTKLKRLMIAELLGGGEDEPGQPQDPKKPEDQGWTQRWVTKIVDNIQIFVDKVHIRYEDDRTFPDRPFVFGITLESLHAQSTDENWTPTFLNNTNQSLVHKLVSLKNLTVYWDSSAEFVDAIDAEDLRDKMDLLTHQDDQNFQPTHHYLLSPINSELRVILNKDEANLSIPKIALNFMFQRVAFALEENQFGEMMKAIDSFSLYQRGAKFRKFRPSVPPTENAKAWWRFAVDSTLQNERERRKVWNMDYIRQAIKDRRQYILLFTKKKQHEDQKITFPAEDDEELATMEKRLTYEQILLFRQLANAFVKKERERLKAAGKGGGGGGWFSSWFKSNTLETSGLELTDELMKELYDIVGDEAAKKDTPASDLPKEYVKIGINFLLDEGSLEMKTLTEKKESLSLAKALFKGFDITLAIREGSMSFTGGLKTMEVLDYYTPNTRFPALISPVWADQKQRESKEDTFLGIKFDLNPLDDPNPDFRVKLNMKPLEVVFNMTLVNRIIKFFVAQNDSPALQNLQQEALRQFDALQKHSFEQLTWTLQNKKVMDIHIEASAPSIIIPQSFTDEDCNMLVVDLGHLSVNTRLKGDEKERNKILSQLRPGDADSADIEATEDDFYDKLFLTLNSLQALIANKADNWRDFDAERRKSAQIINKFDLDLCLQLCLVPSDVLTKVKLSGQLPSLRLKVSDSRCKELFKTLKTVLDSLKSDEEKELPPARHRAASVPAVKALASSATKKSAPPSVLTEEDKELLAQQKKVLLAKKVVYLYFAIPEITLEVTQEDGKPSEEPLATLSVKHIMVTVVKRTFDLHVNVVLHDVVVEDFFQRWGPKFRYLLSSDLAASSDPFLQLDFQSISKESPEYEDVDQSIDLKLGNLHMICTRETLLALLNFVNVNVISQLQQMESDKQLTEQELINPLPEPQKESSALLLHVRLGTVQLALNRAGHMLATLQLNRSSFRLGLSKTGTINLAGKLGNISELKSIFLFWMEEF